MQQLPWNSVLITGGTGFIGQRLCERLSSAGVRILVWTRNARRAQRRLGPAVFCSERLDELVAQRPPAVINLAGAGIADLPWTARRKQTLLDSRVALTERLQLAFRELPPQVLVSGSAMGFYGTSSQQHFTEEDNAGTGFGAELCERWEAAARAFESPETRVVRLRTGLVLGPGGMLKKLQLPFWLGLGGRLGGGDQWMSWIHREDVVGLIEHCLCNEAINGPVNATAPEPVTNQTFTRTLGRVMRRPTPIPVPAWLLRAGLGQMAEELLLNGARVLPEVAQTTGYQFRYPDLESALRAALGREATESR